MKYLPNQNESIVYYVVAAVSIFVLIAYGTQGDIPPIVGFFITGMAVYILYPNETIAMILALIVSAVLRRTRLGMENAPEDDAPDDPEENPKDTLDAVQKKLKEQFVEEDKTSKKKQAFTLSPADYTNTPPPTTQDMDKLSTMIDKTMKLIEMLPDGFLQHAANNNPA